MLVAPPPYALIPANFRFAALAGQAGRAPLGGRREVALAMYLAARLAQDALPDRELSESARLERATHAKQWLSNLALPAAIRPTIVAVIDASAADVAAAGQALRAALLAVGDSLDRNGRAELVQLAGALEAK